MNQLVGRRHVMDSSPPEASKKRAEAFGEFLSSKICLLREFLDAEASQKEVLLGDTDGFIHRFHDVLQSLPLGLVFEYDFSEFIHLFIQNVFIKLTFYSFYLFE